MTTPVQPGPALFAIGALVVLGVGVACAPSTPSGVEQPLTTPAVPPAYVPSTTTPPTPTTTTTPLTESYPADTADPAPVDSGGDYDVDRHHHIPHPHVHVCVGHHLRVCS
jgi:hypothetical protein